MIERVGLKFDFQKTKGSDLAESASENLELTQILSDVEAGRRSSEELLPLVYSELRKLASFRMKQELPGQTLQATALVHEAWLRIQPANQTSSSNDSSGSNDASTSNDHSGWESRGHFFAAASEAMRRILVDHARKKRSAKRGGEFNRVELESIELSWNDDQTDILELDQALAEFENIEPRKARLVKLRYFAGLNEEEAAQAMDISRATASRYWTFARAWLFDRLKKIQND